MVWPPNNKYKPGVPSPVATERKRKEKKVVGCMYVLCMYVCMYVFIKMYVWSSHIIAEYGSTG